MPSHLQVMAALNVFWRESKMAKAAYEAHALASQSLTNSQILLSSFLGPKADQFLGLERDAGRPKKLFERDCYEAMENALEIAEKAGEWENEAKGFVSTLTIVQKPDAVYVESRTHPRASARLVGPFQTEQKAKEWMQTYGDSMRPEVEEFLKEESTGVQS